MTKHAPATHRRKPSMDDQRAALRVQVAQLTLDRARLVDALQAITDSHEILERERGSMRATHTTNARALLRELDEVKP